MPNAPVRRFAMDMPRITSCRRTWSMMVPSEKPKCSSTISMSLPLHQSRETAREGAVVGRRQGVKLVKTAHEGGARTSRSVVTVIRAVSCTLAQYRPSKREHLERWQRAPLHSVCRWPRPYGHAPISPFNLTPSAASRCNSLRCFLRGDESGRIADCCVATRHVV